MSLALEQRVLALLDRVASPCSVHDVATQLGLPDDRIEPAMATLAAWGLVVAVEYENDPPAYRHKDA